MPIDLNALKESADAKSAKQKGKMKAMNEISDATTNLKNRTLSALTGISDAIKSYLEGCGLLVSDNNAYQLYLNIYLLSDDDLEELLYHYTLSKIDKKTGKIITWYKDNVKLANGTGVNELTKKTGWTYSASTSANPEGLVFTSGLKEFLSLKYVTEEEVNTAINIGLNVSSEAIAKLGVHPFFYFKTSRTKDVMGDDEVTQSELPIYDDAVALLITRVKRITEFISGIEEQRSKIVSIMNNALDGKPITPACYTIESDVINQATNKVETITISSFDVTRDIDPKVLTKPFNVLCTTSLTSEVTLIDMKDNEITIPAGKTFRDWCYMRFNKTLSMAIIDATIADCEKASSSGFANLFSMSSLKTVSNALSSFATKALEAAKAKALAQMTTSVNNYAVSKADSALLENKLMAQAADISTGNTNVVANTAYLVSTFKSMKDNNKEACKNLELLSDDKTFVEKKFDFIGSYVCHFGDTNIVMVTNDVVNKSLNMYTIKDASISLTKSVSYNTFEYFKISKMSGLLTVNSDSTSTISKWIRIDTTLTTEVNPIIKSTDTYTDDGILIHKTDVIGILKIIGDDIFIVTKYQKYSEKEYNLGLVKLNFTSRENATVIYEFKSDVIEVAGGLDSDLIQDYLAGNKSAGGLYTLPLDDMCIPYSEVCISPTLFHFILKIKDVGYSRGYKIPITNIISYLNKEIEVMTASNESLKLVETNKYDYLKNANFKYDTNKKLIYIKDDTLLTEEVALTVDTGYILNSVETAEEYIKTIDGKTSFNYISKNLNETYFILGEPCAENTLSGIFIVGDSPAITKQMDSYADVKTSSDSKLNNTTTNIDSLLDTKTSSLVSGGTSGGLSSIASGITSKASNIDISVSIDLTSEATVVTLDMITLYDICNMADGCETHEQLHQDIYDALLKKEAKSCAVETNVTRKYFVKTWYDPV